ncbi:MAG: radical SAM protein, partial [Deltaproteobacteria bacterium]|nr:radical SAM protein [Deltaproteobacteria bacterium]
RDRALNYYHQFLDETGHAETIAARFSVVGFSLMGPTQVVPTLTLALRLKELRSDLVVVLGGPWVSLFAAELAAAAPLRPFFDVLVEGEGEAAWLAIARAGGAAPGASVPNAWVRTAKGLAPPRDRFVAYLAEIGTPSFDGLDLDCYGAPRPVLLQSGRGCYWDRCAFCVHTGRGQAALGPRVRLRPLALVAADIAELVRKHAPRYLAFADLSVSPARMRQLCRIMEDGRIDLPWFAFVRLDPGFDRSLLERMRRAGCLKLNFGLESGSARILELLDKGHDLETARRIIDDAIDLGFRVTLHTMAGLPGESREDLDLTLALVDRYAPAVHESYTEIFRLEPGTRIHRSPHSFGIEPRPTDRGFDNCVPFENRGGLSQAEAMAIIEERLYAFYRDREELIYRSRSHFGMKHKHDFAAPSRFRARFRVELGGRVFADEVTVETRGGGILRRVGGGEGQS